MVAAKIIYAVLSTDPAVGPRVYDGATAGTYRIFPIRVPVSADQLPLIAYQGTGLDLRYIMTGPGGLVMQKVQIACLAADYDDASDLASEVMAALTVPTGFYGGVKLSRFFIRDQSEEEITLPGAGEEVLTYVNTVEVDVWYYQPADWIDSSSSVSSSSSSSSSSTSSHSSNSSISSPSSNSSSSSSSST